MKTKKERKEAYKSMKFRAGIYQIKNIRDDRILLKTSADLERAFNSDLFQLTAGMHSNPRLQDDWNKAGAENFEFSIFDELKINDSEAPADINKELKALLELHLAELKSRAVRLY